MIGGINSKPFALCKLHAKSGSENRNEEIEEIRETSSGEECSPQHRRLVQRMFENSGRFHHHYLRTGRRTPRFVVQKFTKGDASSPNYNKRRPSTENVFQNCRLCLRSICARLLRQLPSDERQALELELHLVSRDDPRCEQEASSRKTRG